MNGAHVALELGDDAQRGAADNDERELDNLLILDTTKKSKRTFAGTLTPPLAAGPFVGVDRRWRTAPISTTGWLLAAAAVGGTDCCAPALLAYENPGLDDRFNIVLKEEVQ